MEWVVLKRDQDLKTLYCTYHWKKTPPAASLSIARRLLTERLVILRRHGFLSAFFILSLLFADNVLAQHSHGRRNTVDFEHETVPAHDQVLKLAPEHLIIRFSEYVRLAKLTLKVEDRETINIDFQFSLVANRVFTQELPELAKADYYTAEWAALNSDNILIYGYFCFSFGPGAIIPTTVINSRVFPSAPF